MISVCVAHSISSSGLSSASKFTLKVEPDQQPLKDADESRRLAVLPFCMTVELPVSLVPLCRRVPSPADATAARPCLVLHTATASCLSFHLRCRALHLLACVGSVRIFCISTPVCTFHWLSVKRPFLRKQCVSLRLFCSRPQTVACKIPRKMYKTHIKRDPLGVIRR